MIARVNIFLNTTFLKKRENIYVSNENSIAR